MLNEKHSELTGEMLPFVKNRSYENHYFTVIPLEALSERAWDTGLKHPYNLVLMGFFLSIHKTPMEGS